MLELLTQSSRHPLVNTAGRRRHVVPQQFAIWHAKSEDKQVGQAERLRHSIALAMYAESMHLITRPSRGMCAEFIASRDGREVGRCGPKLRDCWRFSNCSGAAPLRSTTTTHPRCSSTTQLGADLHCSSCHYSCTELLAHHSNLPQPTPDPV